VYISYLLELYAPLCKLFWCKVEAISLMCDVMILAKDTAKVAAGEENRS